jgi:hypothetical protein
VWSDALYVEELVTSGVGEQGTVRQFEASPSPPRAEPSTRGCFHVLQRRRVLRTSSIDSSSISSSSSSGKSNSPLKSPLKTVPTSTRLSACFGVARARAWDSESFSPTQPILSSSTTLTHHRAMTPSPRTAFRNLSDSLAHPSPKPPTPHSRRQRSGACCMTQRCMHHALMSFSFFCGAYL